MGIGPKPPALGRNVLKFRKQRDISLDELAQRSGVSKAMLSQVEQEKVNPTVAVVWKISHGLGVTIHELLGTEENNRRRVEVTRKENATILREESCEVQILSPIEMAEDLEFYILRFQAGGSLVSSPHFPRTEEFTTCLSGTLEITSAEGTVLLNPGDMAHYAADVQHAIRAKGGGAAEAFLIVRYAK